MKTYTVQQIAEMLNTSDETVRRWIRSNKLTAQPYTAKKMGSLVTETALTEFLNSKPKYRQKITAAENDLLSEVSSALVLSSVSFLAGFISRLVSRMAEEGKSKKDLTIPAVKKELRKELKRLDTLLAEKEAQRQDLKKQLDEVESAIWHIKNNMDGCNYILTHEGALKRAATGDPTYKPM